MCIRRDNSPLVHDGLLVTELMALDVYFLSVGSLSLPLLVEADVVRLFGCKVVLTRQELSYHRFISFGKLFF
ncbi:hypothetical protein [Fictibacillus enclensis]|uniref:hypothetical protein n=1 Tax=Fictibacillus enclensis TaxID=1017270 RepID=UPI0025A03F97|nr:hypothetical protein [Fictibacillus enclensis]